MLWRCKIVGTLQDAWHVGCSSLRACRLWGCKHLQLDITWTFINLFDLELGCTVLVEFLHKFIYPFLELKVELGGLFFLPIALLSHLPDNSCLNPSIPCLAYSTVSSTIFLQSASRFPLSSEHLLSYWLAKCETFWFALCSASSATAFAAFFSFAFASLSSFLSFKTSCSATVRDIANPVRSDAIVSVFSFCTLLRKFTKAHLLKLLVQLLDLLFHDLCMSFLGFASKSINVTLIYVGKIVCTNWKYAWAGW